MKAEVNIYYANNRKWTSRAKAVVPC